jgi:outer membrane protein insertion porin family
LVCIRAALLAVALLLPVVPIGPAAAQSASPPAAQPAPLPTVAVPSHPVMAPHLPPAAPATPSPAGISPAGVSPAAAPGAAAPAAPPPVLTPAPGTIQSIRIEGNERIESGTIRSYMLVQPGDPFDPARIDRSLKTLYATGLFQDVSLTRQGDILVVKLVENPLVNRVAYEGNSVESDDQLRDVVQLRPRAVFTPAAAEADRQRILDAYAKRGRFATVVTPQIIRLAQNRVDVVFQISDGPSAFIARIAFVGNRAFSESRLSDAINSREHTWWRFLSTSDEYDPARINFDKELLRRFYLKNGYADFDIKDVSTELAPDRSAFFLTFTINEGERYRIGKITINSQLRGLDGNSLRKDLQFDEGDWYDGEAVGRTADDMETDVRSRGYSFVEAKPDVTRNQKTHTVDLTFTVDEGPRVYVERINIVGDVRTKDKVIRRELRLAEGDAFDAAAVRRSRQRLEDLGYFNTVTITPSEGSASDKAILTTTVQEKSTGEVTLGGGYATDAGALVDAGISENNLIGTGMAASVNGVLAQRDSSIDASITNPYTFDRNLVTGADVFLVQTDFLGTEPYDEKRVGFAARAGYDYNDHLRQSWSYTLVGRTVFNVETGASFYIENAQGYSVLSQLSQQLTLDYRDSKVDPHSGSEISFGTDGAGLGGNAQFIRTRVDAHYYIPLERLTGNPDWVVALSAGTGYLFNLGQQEQLIDRFYLGGDNLRGFETGGAGPHDSQGDPLGGRFIYTGTTELRFPLPVSTDFGITGRTFIDVGGLTQASFEKGNCAGAPSGVCPQIFDSSAPRVGIGVGISWKTPLGLINIDLTPFVVKQSVDQTQLFRFGFGTRF